MKMKQHLIIFALLHLTLTLESCGEDSRLHADQCLKNSCINDRLSRLKMTFRDASHTVGKLQFGMTIGVRDQIDDEYEIKIRYADVKKHELVADPQDCLDWTIYQNKDHFKMDSSRLNLVDESDVERKPTWPSGRYRFNTNIEAGEITFVVLRKDLQERQCKRIQTTDYVTYQCYFELAFKLRGITQVSSYFLLRVQEDLEQPQPKPKVEVIELDDYYKSKERPQVPVNGFESSLSFCLDAECQETPLRPSDHLFVNKLIYLKHSLNDMSSFIDNPQLFFESSGMKFQILEHEFEIIKKTLGHSIYALRVPLVSEHVDFSVAAQTSNGQTITTQIKLSEMQQKRSQEVITAQPIVMGPIFKVESSVKQNPIHSESNFVSTSLDMDDENIMQQDPVLVQDHSNDYERLQRMNEIPSTSAPQNEPTSFGGSVHNRDIPEIDYHNQDVQCELNTHFVYNGKCLEKSCLHNKLYRVRMTPLHHYDNDPKTLQDHIAFQIDHLDQDGDKVYRVRLSYGDEKDNQLASDPEKCIDWRVYQIKNQHDVDNRRMNMQIKSSDGDKPDWPVPKYSYVDEMKAAQLTFIVSHEDLDNYDCQKFAQGDEISYECFFEFAMVIRGTTQISYYFNLKVVVDSNDIQDIKLLEGAIKYVTQ